LIEAGSENQACHCSPANQWLSIQMIIEIENTSKQHKNCEASGHIS
jgi:hypothetical protein